MNVQIQTRPYNVDQNLKSFDFIALLKWPNLFIFIAENMRISSKIEV